MFEEIPGLIMKSGTVGYIGKIENVVGMFMEVSGGCSSVGDTVLIYNEERDRQTPVEVIGFKGGRIQSMTYEATGGTASGSFVCSTRQRLRASIGGLLKDRVTNAMGRPIDGRNTFHANQYHTVNSSYANPLDRSPIRGHLEFGTKAIDGLNTIGKGQRVGIFAGSGVSKSTPMGMIARSVRTDTNVVALVRKCDREVLEFIQKDLGEEGMKRLTLAVATSDQLAMLRMKCPLAATTIAGYLKDQGFDVLLMIDSPARYAMVQREIGLVIGEPPAARGYIPSIYAEFPKLLERSDSFGQGSITRVRTALVEGDDMNEPIVDTVRGILGEYIVLSRQLANENHFLTVDIGASISRLMAEIVDEEHRKISSRFRNALSLYQKDSDLIPVDAYKKGANVASDEAVSKISKMDAFLQQGIDERFSREETLGLMKSIIG